MIWKNFVSLSLLRVPPLQRLEAWALAGPRVAVLGRFLHAEDCFSFRLTSVCSARHQSWGIDGASVRAVASLAGPDGRPVWPKGRPRAFPKDAAFLREKTPHFTCSHFLASNSSFHTGLFFFFAAWNAFAFRFPRDSLPEPLCVPSLRLCQLSFRAVVTRERIGSPSNFLPIKRPKYKNTGKRKSRLYCSRWRVIPSPLRHLVRVRWR